MIWEPWMIVVVLIAAITFIVYILLTIFTVVLAVILEIKISRTEVKRYKRMNTKPPKRPSFIVRVRERVKHGYSRYEH